jgi:hypothetical protein
MSNFLKERSGGGLFDDGATIINSKFKVRQLPWHSEEEPALQNALNVTYLGTDGREWTENEITTGALRPTNDGEGLIDPKTDAAPEKLNPNSKIAKFIDYLEEGGFNVDTLLVDGELKISRLNGAQFSDVVKVDKVDKEGNVKKNDKGFAYQTFYPGKFVGYAEGYANTDTPDADIQKKAVELISGFLKENGGQATRPEVIRFLSSSNDNDVAALTQAFIKGLSDAPWKVDGGTISTLPI